jgi:Ca-activated chloride channel family protein
MSMDGLNKAVRELLHANIFRSSVTCALLLSSAACALFGQEPPQQQGPPLKVTVNRVNVGVTVTDSLGKFVSGLQRQDFRIFDNDVAQPIANFLPVEEPAQFLLLIESGPSVFLFAKNHILAADTLLTSVAPDDQVAIATYSRSLNPVLDFTADKSTARLALRSIDFHTGFGDLDLFSSISAAIDGLASMPGKKTIVLLSTGLDTSPGINWESLLAKLQIADVRIIAVSLAGDLRKPNKKKKLTANEKMARAELKKGFAEGDDSLQQLSTATGGRVFFARDAKEFAKAYAEIADLLRHEYTLAFAPTSFDGQVHALRVEVDRAGVRVDHRPAYLAPVSP